MNFKSLQAKKITYRVYRNQTFVTNGGNAPNLGTMEMVKIVRSATDIENLPDVECIAEEIIPFKMNLQKMLKCFWRNKKLHPVERNFIQKSIR
jgi:hypothetical protein